MMEIAFESNASLIFDKLDQQSWTMSDVNEEDYRLSWCQYRNSAVENKENIEPVVDDDDMVCEKEDEVGNSEDEPMELAKSLSVCCIATPNNSLEEDNAVHEPPPVKRARIVKPPQAEEADRKSTAKPEPFKFLAREQENRQRREARRTYYELLTKKTSPQPFKAKPAPKFKPSPLAMPKKVDAQSATPKSQTPKASTIAKSNVLQPIETPKTCRTSLGLAQKRKAPAPTAQNLRVQALKAQTPKAPTPKAQAPKAPAPRVQTPAPSAKSKVLHPITIATPSKPAGSLSKTPRATTAPRIQVIYRSPSSAASKGLSTPVERSVAAKAPVNRGFNASNPPIARNSPRTSTPVQQRPKPTEDTSRRRTLTIPKAPQLSTANRARERSEFEVMMQEKLRQRDAVRKMEIAAARQAELEEIAQLRRATVHKPIAFTKRTPTHPMLPVFVKRPRWV